MRGGGRSGGNKHLKTPIRDYAGGNNGGDNRKQAGAVMNDSPDAEYESAGKREQH
jgi:hypothetical protein